MSHRNDEQPPAPRDSTYIRLAVQLQREARSGSVSMPWRKLVTKGKPGCMYWHGWTGSRSRRSLHDKRKTGRLKEDWRRYTVL
jgi:hypothetical protein